MRIGIFGGSFDPIHSEHISLAKQAVTDLSLDRLFVMPAASPPHKPWRALAPNDMRFELCRLAFECEEKITVSDYELATGGTSYTYLTVRHFRSLYPDAQLYFLMGADMLRDFPSWKNPADILENCTLAVCSRAGDDCKEIRRDFLVKFGKDFQLLTYQGKPVSSTEIRVLAGAGMEITDYTDEKCAAYIAKNAVYEIEGAKAALALEKPARKAHSIRVAMLGVERAKALRLNERQVLQACLLHDVAKNLPLDSPLLEGFSPPADCPPSVLHQYAGEYVARNHLGVTDEAVLSAIACHTSGKEDMSPLDKLVFLADLLEVERSYPGVDNLRRLFWKDIDACLLQSLEDTVEYLTRSGLPIYGKTLAARDYYRQQKEKIYGNDKQ